MRAGIGEIEDLWYTYLNSACPAVVDMYLDRVSYRVDTRRSPLRGTVVKGCDVQLRGRCARCHEVA